MRPRTLRRWAASGCFALAALAVVTVGYVQGRITVTLPLFAGFGGVAVPNAAIAALSFAATLLVSGGIFFTEVLREHDRGPYPTTGPEIAAVVPSYGDAGALHRSVESLLDADYEDVHVYVVCEPGDERRYPGVHEHVHYDEGVFVGYRGFDRDNVEPRFPFGHGLSYTEFAYENLTVERVEDNDGSAALNVSVTVENRADRPGREVVQAYVEPPAAPGTLDRPERELGDFAAVELDGGERRRVSLLIPRRALARFDRRDGWTVDPGQYAVVIGRSSRDEQVRASIDYE